MSNLVRPSEAAALAIHACALMAAAGGAAMTVKRMAGAIGASEAHLSKVLQRLSRAGLVTGTRGPGGGFKLALKPASVSLRRVYEAVEGPLVGSGCLIGVPLCRGALCPLASLLERVEREIAGGLSRVTLADLAPAVTRGLSKTTTRKPRQTRARENGTRSSRKGR
jgi:Rrf2 family protein